MDGYGPETYGERIAEVYDEMFHPPTSAADTVEFLAGFAGDGRVLELAIGTGRVALPLAARGVEVHGIDASPAMVGRLHAKPGGESITVHAGDFADVGADGTFSLVYVVFNTFFALLSQDEQVRCFRKVAERLADGGVFLVEAFVPNPSIYVGGQAVRAANITTDAANLHAARHDLVTQTVFGQQIII